MPAKNLKRLMLRDEVVKAVTAGQFHIWAVNTIDEGIEVLTGIEAGQRRPDGGYPEGSISYKVEQNLKEMARKLRYFTQPPSPDGHASAAPQPLPGTPVK